MASLNTGSTALWIRSTWCLRASASICFWSPASMNSTGMLAGEPDLGEDLLGPVDVVVGQHQLLHPGLVLGEDGDGFADAADAHQQHLHVRPPWWQRAAPGGPGGPPGAGSLCVEL